MSIFGVKGASDEYFCTRTLITGEGWGRGGEEYKIRDKRIKRIKY